jgi:hypothetical protein
MHSQMSLQKSVRVPETGSEAAVVSHMIPLMQASVARLRKLFLN